MGGWLSWVVAGLGALVVLLVLARRSFRTSVRRELLEVLARDLPGVTVLDEAPTHLRLRLPGGAEGQAQLERLYAAVAALGTGAPPEARQELYRQWVATVRESSQSSGPLDLETHGERVLPRIVGPGFFDQLPPEAGIPHTPLGETGLSVTYVLDHPHSVAYLTREHLDELGLDRTRAHALALRNLAGKTDPAVLRKALGSGQVSVIASDDTYGAARLLLVPPQLESGQAVVAAIPDRDTLVLMPGPDADLEGARKLARTPRTDRPLFDRPLRVTRDGIALA